MSNFDLTKYLAEGRLLKENTDFPELEDEFEGAMDAMVVEPEVYLKDILNASADEIVSDDYYEIMNAVEQGVYSKDEAVKLAKSWAKEKLSTLAEGKLLKEAKEIDMAKSFLENKGLEVEAVDSGNKGHDKAGEEGKAFIWDGGEGDMNYKSDGKEAFYVYMPFNEEIMKEMKSKFPVIKIGGKSGKYYEVIIEKK